MRQPSYRPMLATDAEAPFSSDDWTFEVKWDGIRAIAYVDSTVSVRTRNGNEVIGRFPELAELASLARGTVLDGEIVLMSGGKTDIQGLFGRLQKVRPVDIGHASRELPVTYVVFDILEKDGQPLTGLPIEERRRILAGSVTEGPHVVLARVVEGRGLEYFEASINAGLEGIMAKRKGSRYEPGVRSGDWKKIRRLRSCDCIVLGYTKGAGRRSGSFGALVIGLYDEGKSLVCIGKVGTGFTDRDLTEFVSRFSQLADGAAPVPGAAISGEVIWLRPGIVIEVGYHSVTKEGLLRMPRYLRVRDDKAPEECTTGQLPDIPEYRKKRDFMKTPEPVGGTEIPGGNRIFVVHEHHSRRLHFDFRLERDGVLRSFAVPKGIPEKPGEKHLAVETEDHPLEYAKFEGTIPSGEYGAGTVSIWDSGVYETLEWTDKTIEVVLAGRRLKGRYILVRFRRAGMNQWLMFRAGE